MTSPICLNAWCFEKDGSFNLTKGTALLAGYQSVRPLSDRGDRGAADPVARLGAALLADAALRLADDAADGGLVTKKDPLEYLRKLRFHRAIGSPSEYGLIAAMMKHVDIFTDGACSGNPGPGGWGAVLRFTARRKGTVRRRGRDDQQPHGADGGDLGAEGAEDALRGRSHTDSKYVMDGISKWIHRLEEERLEDRRQEAGEERRTLAGAGRGATAATR